MGQKFRPKPQIQSGIKGLLIAASAETAAEAIRGNKPAKQASMLVFVNFAQLLPHKHPHPMGCAFYWRHLKTVKRSQVARMDIFPYFSMVFRT